MYFLADIFAVELCAYSVMSNHTHVVLKVDSERALHWSELEVLTRWHRLFKGTILTRQFCDLKQAATLTAAQRHTVKSAVKAYRARLYDISWFMRALNEYIARQANKEDACSGRFWEGRFKSQAIVDEASLAACMAYVDLNPVRAGMASTPEGSAYTSIKRRIENAKVGKQPALLCPFIGNHSRRQSGGLPFRLEEYLQFVDSVGRVTATNKRGAIAADIAPLLTRTGLDEVRWSDFVSCIETHFTSRISLALARRRETKHAWASSS